MGEQKVAPYQNELRSFCPVKLDVRMLTPNSVPEGAFPLPNMQFAWRTVPVFSFLAWMMREPARQQLCVTASETYKQERAHCRASK